jgi:hypothetical protein
VLYCARPRPCAFMGAFIYYLLKNSSPSLGRHFFPFPLAHCMDNHLLKNSGPSPGSFFFPFLLACCMSNHCQAVIPGLPPSSFWKMWKYYIIGLTMQGGNDNYIKRLPSTHCMMAVLEPCSAFQLALLGHRSG